MGFALDPLRTELTDDALCDELDGLDEAEAQTLIDRLSGRFVALRLSSEHGATAQQDAMGLRAAYHTDPQYPPITGSHMLLVAGQVRAPLGRFGMPMHLVESGESTYPRMTTARVGIKRLLPNLQWLGDRQSVRRIFPTAPREEATTEHVVRLIKSRVGGTLQGLAGPGVPLMASLTAGMDSRVTASVLAGIEDVEYFTYDVQYQAKNRTNRHDVKGAKRLAERLELRHTVLELLDRDVPADLKKQMDINWPLYHSPKLVSVYLERLPQRLHIGSTGFGIASAYWARHGYSRLPLDAGEMRRIASSRRVGSAASLDAFHECSNASDFSRIAELGCDAYDLLLWALRVGAWFTSCSHESDIAHDTHVLLNSRETLNALLSVPFEDRKTDSVSRAILAEADPAFLEIPTKGADSSGRVALEVGG
mgnify:CR=1 FL=1